jgi:hypothetical protein
MQPDALGRGDGVGPQQMRQRANRRVREPITRLLVSHARSATAAYASTLAR